MGLTSALSRVIILTGCTPQVERFNRLQKVVQDMGGAHQDMDFMSKVRASTVHPVAAP